MAQAVRFPGSERQPEMDTVPQSLSQELSLQGKEIVELMLNVKAHQLSLWP